MQKKQLQVAAVVLFLLLLEGLCAFALATRVETLFHRLLIIHNLVSIDLMKFNFCRKLEGQMNSLF
jgi:hypothetical protein